MTKEFRNSESAIPAGETVVNAKDFPRFFYARHMQPGLAGYENERILVDADAIKRMLPTFAGRPIYINHRDVVMDTLKQDAVGFVVDPFWNELDGWAWAKIMLIDDEAVNAASNGYSVSNAYIPHEWAGGGMCNNVGYDRAITTGSFTHLALVQDPRYEEAKIFTPEQFKAYQDEKRQQLNALKNSKTEEKKGKPMFEFFKNTRQPVTDVDAETSMEMTNSKGEKVVISVTDMIKAVENAKAPEAKPQTVMVNGKEMPVTELVAAFNALQNAKPAESEKKEEVKEVIKENAAADDSADAAAKAAEKENSKTDHFAELSNANRSATVVTNVDQLHNKVARGQARYGSGN